MLHLLFIVNIAAIIAFAISGALVAARHRLDWVGFVFMACITGIGGGIIRDVIVNDVPVVFQKDIYISDSIIGALSYCLLHTYTPLSEGYALIIGGFSAFIIRALAITQNLTMPAHKGLH